MSAFNDPEVAAYVRDVEAEIHRLHTYAEGLEADARRYRFLRDAAYNLDAMPYVVTGPHGATEPITGAELDKAIDERPELGNKMLERAKAILADPTIDAAMRRMSDK